MEATTILALATGAINAITPFLQKGGEKLTEKVVEEGFEQRSQIWESVKSLFIGDDLTTLGLMEKYPDNEDINNEVKVRLADRLKENPDVAGRLDELLKKLEQFQTSTETNINYQVGDNATNIQGNRNSSINFNQK